MYSNPIPHKQITKPCWVGFSKYKMGDNLVDKVVVRIKWKKHTYIHIRRACHKTSHWLVVKYLLFLPFSYSSCVLLGEEVKQKILHKLGKHCCCSEILRKRNWIHPWNPYAPFEELQLIFLQNLHLLRYVMKIIQSYAHLTRGWIQNI
jgi:hypothetical protein